MSTVWHHNASFNVKFCCNIGCTLLVCNLLPTKHDVISVTLDMYTAVATLTNTNTHTKHSNTSSKAECGTLYLMHENRDKMQYQSATTMASKRELTIQNQMLASKQMLIKMNSCYCSSYLVAMAAITLSLSHLYQNLFKCTLCTCHLVSGCAAR